MMESKTTLILGASTNPERYAYLAANRLVAHGHNIINIGNKSGTVAGVAIQPANQIIPGIDTITLYIGAQNQQPLYNYILNTRPRRIIFNPGAENAELEKLANSQGIQTTNACTLVLLATGQY